MDCRRTVKTSRMSRRRVGLKLPAQVSKSPQKFQSFPCIVLHELMSLLPSFVDRESITNVASRIFLFVFGMLG
jgi:hypothetical protein